MRAALLCLLATASAVVAQENPISSFDREAYTNIRAILVRAAEKMPEASYSFRPVETVRTFGQVVGHVADTQYLFCAKIRGEKNPAPGIEKGKTSKAELIAALKDAFTYCDQAYSGVTDVTGVQTVKMFGQDTPKLAVMEANHMHTLEHYGNLVTYLRMKGIVPPTSDPEFQPGGKR